MIIRVVDSDNRILFPIDVFVFFLLNERKQHVFFHMVRVYQEEEQIDPMVEAEPILAENITVVEAGGGEKGILPASHKRKRCDGNDNDPDVV
jgi:hypothetical protein